MRITATRSLSTAPGNDGGIGCVFLYTLGLGKKIVPGVRLDQESFYMELLLVATQAEKKKKKNPDRGQEEKWGLQLKLWS